MEATGTTELSSVLADLRKAAWAGLERYNEAKAYLKGPRPQGKMAVKDMIADGTARMERAARYYRRKLDALREADPQDPWLGHQLPEIL